MSDPIQLTQQPGETTPPVAGDAPEKKWWLINYSMWSKLIIAFLAVALIPLGVLVYINYLSMKNLLTENINRSLAAGASKAAASVEAFIEENVEGISEEAQRSELLDYLRLPVVQRAGSTEEELVEDTLRELASRDETDNLSYALLDSEGLNVIDTLTSNIGQDESDYDYFYQSMQTDEPFVSPVTFDLTTGEAGLYFSSPVHNPSGKIVGVLRARYSAAVLQQLIEQYNGSIGEESFAILLDENHIRLAHGPQPDLNFKSIVPLEPGRVEKLQADRRLPAGSVSELSTNIPTLKDELDNASSRRSHHFTAQLNETGDRLGWAAFAKLGNERLPSSWSVVFAQPQDVNLDLLDKQVFTTWANVLLIAIVIFIVTLTTTRRLSNPLSRLSAVAQQVASGALGLHAQVETRDEVGELATAFNSMIIQMRDLSGNLDQYVADRTHALGDIVRALETSTQIGRQITTILDINELLRYTVKRIQIEFDFYYTHIYLIEDETGDLVMVEGSGEVGRKLKARNHRLTPGQGIVGTVAKTNEYFLSSDVSKALNFVSSPLLPDTRSELALPLRKGDRVLGVLDIQDDEINRFTPADVLLMQSTANQTAVAIENARLLAETQAALKEVERLNRRLTREGWDEFGEEITTSGYRFSDGTSAPISSDADVWLPPMKQAAAERRLVKQTRPGNGDNSEAELAVPLVLRGEVIGVLGVKRDETTDWAEEEVAAVEAVANQVAQALENARLSKEREKTIIELKEVDRIKSEFLTSMSHELRTPLNSIIGFADVILQGIDGEISEVAMNDVRLIYSSGQHLLALINDVLDLARIEASKMELVREPLVLEEVIEDVLAATSALVKNKPVGVVTEIAEALPMIYADKLRFKQVLINLVNNAIKFTEKGNVIIRARMWEENPNQALISVIDEGLGISLDMRNIIFDRFRQIDASTRRKAEGTGLGLAICKELVELHGGTIGVTGEEEAGSEFYFTIPFVGVVFEEDEPVAIEAGN